MRRLAPLLAAVLPVVFATAALADGELPVAVRARRRGVSTPGMRSVCWRV